MSKEKSDQEDDVRRSQIKLKQEQIDLERACNEARVFKVKQYGDAMRNSMSKMKENSPIEFLPFIKNFERLVKELVVPKELYVTLLTPYSSEKCWSLFNRLQGGVATSYDYIKDYLMDQLHLAQFS